MTDLQLLILILFFVLVLYPSMSKGYDMLIADLSTVLRYIIYGIAAIIAYIVRRLRR